MRWQYQRHRWQHARQCEPSFVRTCLWEMTDQSRLRGSQTWRELETIQPKNSGCKLNSTEIIISWYEKLLIDLFENKSRISLEMLFCWNLIGILSLPNQLQYWWWWHGVAKKTLDSRKPWLFYNNNCRKCQANSEAPNLFHNGVITTTLERPATFAWNQLERVWWLVVHGVFTDLICFEFVTFREFVEIIRRVDWQCCCSGNDIGGCVPVSDILKFIWINRSCPSFAEMFWFPAC